MEDDSQNSLINSLKNEWSLLWGSLAGEDDSAEGTHPQQAELLKSLSLEDIRAITRELSRDRRHLNVQLESLTKELELNTAKLESMKLIGANGEDVLQRIEELHDQGQRVSQELARVDLRLRTARNHEVRLADDITSAS